MPHEVLNQGPGTAMSAVDSKLAVRREPIDRIAGQAAGEVLLVDDSRAISSMLIARIDALDGVSCRHAATHAATRTLLEEDASRFFVAVLDLNLPDAPNGEVIGLVEQYGIPVIVLTATLDATRRDELFARGVADYVVKDGLGGIEYVARLVDRMAHSRGTKILVVDDSKAFREYVATLLRQHGYAPLTAIHGKAGLEMLRAHPDISLVITDYHMPEMDGLAMVGEMRGQRSHDELAIIAVSESRRSSLLAQFLKRGATDYLHKSFGVEEFFCRVDQNVDMLRIVRQARDAANRDFLTGLYNRRYFFEQAGQHYGRAVDGENQIMIAMIDVDHFKRVNDSFGHQVGDQALVAIADTLRVQVEGRGLVARLGGEEFACLHLIDGRERARNCLNGIREQIEAIDLRHRGERVPITVSIGATCELGGHLDDMLRAADKGVYAAKDAGRNRIVLV